MIFEIFSMSHDSDRKENQTREEWYTLIKRTSIYKMQIIFLTLHIVLFLMSRRLNILNCRAYVSKVNLMMLFAYLTFLSHFTIPGGYSINFIGCVMFHILCIYFRWISRHEKTEGYIYIYWITSGIDTYIQLSYPTQCSSCEG